MGTGLMPLCLPAAFQTSLLFSKDFGLLSFLRRSLVWEEVSARLGGGRSRRSRGVTGSNPDVLLLQLRETRVEVLSFLEKFLDRVSPRVKGWDQTYAIDITVSYIPV